MFYKQREIIYAVALAIVIILILSAIIKSKTQNISVSKPIITATVVTTPSVSTPTQVITAQPTVQPTVMPTIATTPTVIVVPPSGKHKNYKKNLTVKGNGYALTYSITNASIKDNTISFRLNIATNTNVAAISIAAMDNLKNSFDITPVPTVSSQNYTVTIDPKVLEIGIYVYPLTADLAKIPNLDMSDKPNAVTNLDIGLLRRGR